MVPMLEVEDADDIFGNGQVMVTIDELYVDRDYKKFPDRLSL